MLNQANTKHSYHAIGNGGSNSNFTSSPDPRVLPIPTPLHQGQHQSQQMYSACQSRLGLQQQFCDGIGGGVGGLMQGKKASAGGKTTPAFSQYTVESSAAATNRMNSQQ